MALPKRVHCAMAIILILLPAAAVLASQSASSDSSSLKVNTVMASTTLPEAIRRVAGVMCRDIWGTADSSSGFNFLDQIVQECHRPEHNNSALACQVIKALPLDGNFILQEARKSDGRLAVPEVSTQDNAIHATVLRTLRLMLTAKRARLHGMQPPERESQEPTAASQRAFVCTWEDLLALPVALTPIHDAASGDGITMHEFHDVMVMLRSHPERLVNISVATFLASLPKGVYLQAVPPLQTGGPKWGGLPTEREYLVLRDHPIALLLLSFAVTGRFAKDVALPLGHRPQELLHGDYDVQFCLNKAWLVQDPSESTILDYSKYPVPLAHFRVPSSVALKPVVVGEASLCGGVGDVIAEHFAGGDNLVIFRQNDLSNSCYDVFYNAGDRWAPYQDQDPVRLPKNALIAMLPRGSPFSLSHLQAELDTSRGSAVDSARWAIVSAVRQNVHLWQLLDAAFLQS